MKITGIIPARYNSTRFPGKALVPVGGIPMVCQAAKAATDCPLLSEVYVATDSTRIREVCEQYGFSVLMTDSGHPDPTSRVYEAACLTQADLYVFIGGDEPLVTAADIGHVIQTALAFYGEDSGSPEAPFVINAMTGVRDKAEEADPSNIKVSCDASGRCLSISRSPLKAPPEKTPQKFVSIGVYTKDALAFFHSTPPGTAERETRCDLLRFIENNKTVLFTGIETATLSVDTPGDLLLVEERMKEYL